MVMQKSAEAFRFYLTLADICVDPSGTVIWRDTNQHAPTRSSRWTTDSSVAMMTLAVLAGHIPDARDSSARFYKCLLQA